LRDSDASKGNRAKEKASSTRFEDERLLRVEREDCGAKKKIPFPSGGEGIYLLRKKRRGKVKLVVLKERRPKRVMRKERR